MTIHLKPEQEKFVQEKIASGNYSNADDVIAQAFQLLEAKEERIKTLQNKIAIGTQQIADGQMTDGEIVMNKLQEKIDRLIQESN